MQVFLTTLLCLLNISISLQAAMTLKPLLPLTMPKSTESMFGVANKKGIRDTDQDTTLRQTLLLDGEPVYIAGVFDGHGSFSPTDTGKAASEFAAKRVFEMISERIRELTTPSDFSQALVTILKDVDQEMMADFPLAGTTAVVAVIYQDRLFEAHVGDSRFIAISADPESRTASRTVSHATFDHNLCEESERRNFQQQLKLLESSECGRIDGLYLAQITENQTYVSVRKFKNPDNPALFEIRTLTPSRTLGDSQISLPAEPMAYSCSTRGLLGLVLVCDGITDVMDDHRLTDYKERSEPIAEYVCRLLDEGYDATFISHSLINKALELETEDNVSCVTFLFSQEPTTPLSALSSSASSGTSPFPDFATLMKEHPPITAPQRQGNCLCDFLRLLCCPIEDPYHAKVD